MGRWRNVALDRARPRNRGLARGNDQQAVQEIAPPVVGKTILRVAGRVKDRGEAPTAIVSVATDCQNGY